ncbi:MAG: type VII secretion protein EccE [Micromonosporaceae bacterium]|nr:type VII secretion protein EccE [Micromonosporaceae bacterium]
MHIVQLLLVEVVVVAILATVDRGVAVIVAAAAGVPLLLVTLARRQGRWWLERRLMVRQYHRRRHTSAAGGGGDARLAQLRWFAPGLVVENVAAADGTQVGVARDDAGWYGVVALAPSPGDEAQGVRLDALTAALAEAEQPGTMVQVVVQTVPAPSVETAAASPASYSYRQLLARFGAVPMPADQAIWIAVRVDARVLAEAAPDGAASLDALPSLVAALVRKVTKSLRHAGIAHRVLDADALLDALVRACDLEHAAHAPQPVQPHEEWSEWRSPHLAHRSYWVRGWPSVGQAGAFLAALTGVGALTTLAVTLAPEDDGRADLRALLRVAAPPDELKSACQAVQRIATQAGADLFPLDGEQGPAVYASAPTGGGAR